MDAPDTPRPLRRSPYTGLLIALLLLLGVWPVLAESDLPSWMDALVHGVLFAGLLAAVRYAVRNVRLQRAFLALLVVALVAEGADALIEGIETTLIGQGIAAIFAAFVTVLVLKRVFAPGQITADRILAAVCAYLFIGMIFAHFYTVIWLFDPGSFALPVGEDVRASEFTYFSFVTLTTLGYGEFAPVNPLARSLAYIEAALGQFYIAIIVARLVALQIIHAQAGRDD